MGSRLSKPPETQSCFISVSLYLLYSRREDIGRIDFDADLRVVAPNLVSIDGQSQPAVFLTSVLPWQLQSPLMPNIGILMASTTQGLDRGLELEDNPESLTVKSKVLAYMNRFLSVEQDAFDAVAAEAVKCIINLVVLEVG